MSPTPIMQLTVLAAILGIVVLLLQLIRKTLLHRSSVMAGAAGVIVTVFLGQVATWYVDALPTPDVRIALLSGFVGLLAVQPHVWSVASLCRALALVSLMIATWAIVEQRLTDSSWPLLAAGGLLYVSLLAARSEVQTDEPPGKYSPLDNA